MLTLIKKQNKAESISQPAFFNDVKLNQDASSYIEFLYLMTYDRPQVNHATVNCSAILYRFDNSDVRIVRENLIEKDSKKLKQAAFLMSSNSLQNFLEEEEESIF